MLTFTLRSRAARDIFARRGKFPRHLRDNPAPRHAGAARARARASFLARITTMISPYIRLTELPDVRIRLKNV